VSVSSPTDIAIVPDRCERLLSCCPAAFETLDFRPDYQVEVDPEFPGDGDWHAPTTDQKQWIGTFTAGSTASTGVLRPPDPRRLCCVVAGLAYVVNVDDPGRERSWPTGRP